MRRQSEVASKQRAQIEAARELLKPTPVRLHHTPRWARREFKLYGTKPSWCDHWGSTKLPDGRVAFVSEPYDISPGTLCEIDAIAKRHGWTWWLEALSWWYPGHTFRIVIVRPGPPKIRFRWPKSASKSQRIPLSDLGIYFD